MICHENTIGIRRTKFDTKDGFVGLGSFSWGVDDTPAEFVGLATRVLVQPQQAELVRLTQLKLVGLT